MQYTLCNSKPCKNRSSGVIDTRASAFTGLAKFKFKFFIVAQDFNFSEIHFDMFLPLSLYPESHPFARYPSLTDNCPAEDYSLAKFISSALCINYYLFYNIGWNSSLNAITPNLHTPQPVNNTIHGCPIFPPLLSQAAFLVHPLNNDKTLLWCTYSTSDVTENL